MRGNPPETREKQEKSGFFFHMVKRAGFADG
jgi:hypothetical protein